MLAGEYSYVALRSQHRQLFEQTRAATVILALVAAASARPDLVVRHLYLSYTAVSTSIAPTEAMCNQAATATVDMILMTADKGSGAGCWPGAFTSEDEAQTVALNVLRDLL